MMLRLQEWQLVDACTWHQEGKGEGAGEGVYQSGDGAVAVAVIALQPRVRRGVGSRGKAAAMLGF